MLSTEHGSAIKSGEPPGTPTYTGTNRSISTITVTTYNAEMVNRRTGTTLEECLPDKEFAGVIWLDLKGLNNVKLVQQITEHFNIHPLTLEDILNTGQRPKVEEFDHYTYVALKTVHWREKRTVFTIQPLSLILGNNFVLSFHETDLKLFQAIEVRLASNPNQRLRQQNGDYLLYRLIDAVIDDYFTVMESLSDRIEKLEDLIVDSPTPQNARTIYRIKRQVIMLRKVTWPMREAIGHLLHTEDELLSKFTLLYMRDAYDHTMQVIDTLDTFRDMLASLLDMYLSSITNRMNEIMKTLTIITTIFIPITAIASIYGMNFTDIPGLHWHYGYPTALAAMLCIAIGMIIYFRIRKWI